MWEFGNDATVATPEQAWVLCQLTGRFIDDRFGDPYPGAPSIDNLKLYLTYPPKVAGKPWLEHWQVLSYNEQLSVLCIAVRAILDPEIPEPIPNAMLDTAAYAPFSWLMDCIEMECEMQARTHIPAFEEECEFSYRATALSCLYGLIGTNPPGCPDGPWEGNLVKWFNVLTLITNCFFDGFENDLNYFPPTLDTGIPEILKEAETIEDILRCNFVETSGYCKEYYATLLYRQSLPQTDQEAEKLLGELYRDFINKYTTPPPKVLKRLKAADMLWLMGSYDEIYDRACQTMLQNAYPPFN